MERRVQLAYTEATNIYTLGSNFAHSDLIDAVTRFEKTDLLGSVDPSTARRGRWVLIYGILQTLADISVDAPSVRYRGRDLSGVEVSYHLCLRLKGAGNSAKIPPWNGSSSIEIPDTLHELSHCWTVSTSWRRQHGDDSNPGLAYDEANEWNTLRKGSSAYTDDKAGHRSSNAFGNSQETGDKTGGFLSITGPQIRSFPQPPRAEMHSTFNIPLHIVTPGAHHNNRIKTTRSLHSSPGGYSTWTGSHKWTPPIFHSTGTEADILTRNRHGIDGRSGDKPNVARDHATSPYDKQEFPSRTLSPLDTSPIRMGDDMPFSTRTPSSSSEHELRRGRPFNPSLSPPFSHPIGHSVGATTASSSLESMIAAANRGKGDYYLEGRELGVSALSDDIGREFIDEDSFLPVPPPHRPESRTLGAVDTDSMHNRPTLHHREDSEVLGPDIGGSRP